MKSCPIRCVFESLEARQLLSSTLSGLTGEFFAGEFQTPMVVRTDSQIDFNWANGRPDESMKRNSVFSARWTGQITPTVTGTYTFYTKANSGTQLFVGTNFFDNLAGTTSSVQQETVALTAGTQYPIQVAYLSRASGDARVQLLWSADGIKKQVVPKSVLTPDTTVALPAEGLLGTYFLGSNFQTQVMTRADSKISFDWETGTPDQAIPHHTAFSIRWTGNITAPVSGNYRFRTITDDGVRLFVDGLEIINDWNIHSAQSDTGIVALTAGQTYTIRMDYFQDGAGHDSARLLWRQPGGGVETLVPFTAPKPIAAPTSPINVNASVVSTSQVNLSWNDVADETGFIVLRSADNGTTFAQVGTTAQGVTNFSDTGLATSTEYEYEIVAVDAGGDSPPSTAIAATTLGVQPPAVVASATASATTATITWTSSPTATRYVVERSPDGSTGWAPIGTTDITTLNDTTLANGTIYFYRVTPSNAAGAGLTSNVVSVTTVPAAPTALTATAASQSQINLTWNNVTGETGFIVQESANGTSGWSQIGTTATGVTTFPVGGLLANTHYFFRVIATGGAGNSGPSNVANATTSAALPAYAGLTTIYGMSNTSVYSINTTSGNATQIGSLSFATNAAGRDPVTGDFYYVSTSSPNVEIAAWDPTDGSNHVVNISVPVGSDVDLAAFRDDGIFFLGSDPGNLYAVNSTSGVATYKGSLQANGSTLALHTGDMAFSPDGTLYIETGSELYSVTRFNLNAANGGSSIITATDLGPTGTANLQVAFGQNGVLFGTDSTGKLYTLNLTNGAGTLVANGNGIGMNDLASAPIYSDLSVTQTASALVRGSNAAYTLTVNNAGPQATNGPVTLIDTLPTGLTFVSGTGAGWSFSQSGQTVTITCTGAIAAGASAPAVTLNAAVASSAASTVTNGVSVVTTVFDTNTGNNTSSLNSPVTG